MNTDEPVICDVNFMKKIRPYTLKDHEKVLEIYSLSKLDELINEKENFELAPFERDVKRYNSLFQSKVFVYDDEGVKGYCAYYGNEIRAIFVHPEHRGRGIGTNMIEFLLSLLPNQSELYVAKTNFSAKRIYQKYGFEIVDEFQTKYNGKAVLANKMQRIITS